MIKLNKKTPEQNDVWLFKLDSAEEIIATVTAQDDDIFVISKPRVVAQQLVDDGQGRQSIAISLVPWMTGNQLISDVHINKIKIISDAPAAEDMAKMYTDNTSSIARI